MASSSETYDSVFYRYQREGALASAAVMLAPLRQHVSPSSVLDVGCGAGAWLAVHRHEGTEDILGVDGDYVDRSLLLIEPDRFRPIDIAGPFDLGRRFDLVECLEVAEHVPASAAETLIDNLVRHGDLVLFSAATPGQGGKGHINERPIGYWRECFARRGYRAFDPLRPLVRGRQEVDWWYRFNTLLYANEAGVQRLSAAFAATELRDGQPAADYRPWHFVLRSAVLGLLPDGVVSQLAAVKHRVIASRLAEA